MKRIKIGVLDCSKYDAYASWISSDPFVEAVKLGYQLNNLKDVEGCDGILLTGGEDVHPKFYNKPEYLPLCHQFDIDEKRDAFELQVLEYSQQNEIPLLGICRGLQITNVFFGGSLIPDIPSTGKPDHSKEADKDRYHSIQTIAGSLIREITGVETGEVNSAHHQSADRIGNGLIVSGSSSDGITEVIERENPSEKSFLLLVQWHPERMIDQQSVLTTNIKKAFLESVK